MDDYVIKFNLDDAIVISTQGEMDFPPDAAKVKFVRTLGTKRRRKHALEAGNLDVKTKNIIECDERRPAKGCGLGGRLIWLMLTRMIT